MKLEEFIDSMKNSNTTKKTKSEVKLFTNWLQAENELRCLEEIEPAQLDQYLARFFLSVRNRKGEEYEPDTLKCIQSSINKYHGDKTKINIINDIDFKHSRDVLSAKRKQLKSKGLGNRKRKAESARDEEINLLYSKYLLVTSNPEALINTVWLNSSLHFGMRSRQEHLDMLFGDLELKAASDGLQYVEFTERETKTRKGHGAARSFAPEMFAQPDNPRCPVKAFKAYIRRRPAESLTPESRFYLSISPRYHNKTVVDVENTNICFTLNPMGKNKLGDLVRTMAEKAI